jgi:hypothetical protein
MKRLIALAFAGAALCVVSASAAKAYTYNFYNNTTQTLTDVWMHTVSAFCHDVNWHGSVGPNGSLSLNSASICLVDEININNGAIYWSSSVGLPSASFQVCPGAYQLCVTSLRARRKAH